MTTAAHTSNSERHTDVDPYSDRYFADPYPDQERVRELGPAVWLDRYNCWGLARAEHVEMALRDHETFCSSRGVGHLDLSKGELFRTQSLVIEADPPDHTRARRVLSRVLGPKTVKALKESFRSEAEAIIDPLVERGRFDGFADIAEAFPLKVFPDQLGLPPGDERKKLPLIGALAFNAFGPMNSLMERSLENADELMKYVALNCRRENLRAGSLGAMVHEYAAEEGYSDDDGGMLVRNFLIAGVDTTMNGIGNALFCLATHPDQFAALRADRTLVRSAFEESIRFESPVQAFYRTLTRDVRVEDVTLRKDDKVLLFLAAANRDPRRWDRPDEYDIQRGPNGHVGFGAGIHACVGQMLARLEGESVLGVLADKVKALTLDGEPVRKFNNTLRGFASLPLRIEAA
ncbi:cytochrome P450 [Rhodococcus sp. IEGM 1381]|uniref:cytochrome P450 n=1 Tax=Rhodococcus sp. IEGM 1381 TaxID=3047085 RepID=UPI0024B71C09|nr:cytochrome P450 [Rhodococcus sp. IEGM 1381]MDI9897408.1 cytochrome P450 [Rhodococcus sp. IEGM 1381]